MDSPKFPPAWTWIAVLILAGIGLLCILGMLGYGTYYLIKHLQWVAN